MPFISFLLLKSLTYACFCALFRFIFLKIQTRSNHSYSFTVFISNISILVSLYVYIVYILFNGEKFIARMFLMIL